MTTVELVEEMTGKTISEAAISTTENGDKELIIRCTDGSSFTVGAYQQEGYPVEMLVTQREGERPAATGRRLTT